MKRFNCQRLNTFERPGYFHVHVMLARSAEDARKRMCALSLDDAWLDPAKTQVWNEESFIAT